MNPPLWSNIWFRNFPEQSSVNEMLKGFAIFSCLTSTHLGVSKKCPRVVGGPAAVAIGLYRTHPPLGGTPPAHGLWEPLHGGHGSISQEYQTYTSAHLCDTRSWIGLGNQTKGWVLRQTPIIFWPSFSLWWKSFDLTSKDCSVGSSSNKYELWNLSLVLLNKGKRVHHRRSIWNKSKIASEEL